ncbi:unnamed protein product, partial [marine sediment metagenome]
HQERAETRDRYPQVACSTDSTYPLHFVMRLAVGYAEAPSLASLSRRKRGEGELGGGLRKPNG